MKQILTFCCGFFLLLTNACAQMKEAENHLQPVKGFNQEILNTIAKYTAVFPSNSQFSIAIIKGGEVQYLGAIRQADQLQNIQNQQSIFQIGSITKVFTSTLLADFVQQGTVKLEDPLQQYFTFQLKESDKNNKVITLQLLANHTSGLPRLPDNIMPMLASNPSDPYKNYDETALEKYLKEQLKLTSIPGEKYEYSNLGAGLLGYILSKKSEKSYSTLLQEKIFKPLKMNRSSVNEAAVKEALVQGLNANGDTTSVWHLYALAGAGAIFSTVEDLSKFALANFKENPVFTLQRKETYKINGNMSVGLGWHIIKTKEGQLWYWHNGGTGGYTSSMALDITNQTGIIILSNVSAFHAKMGNIDQLCFSLMKML